MDPNTSRLIEQPDPAYIWAAYGITGLCLMVLTLLVLRRYRRARRSLIAEAEAMEERTVDA